MKFVKKPIVVNAIQWTGTNNDDIVEFMGWKVDKTNYGHLKIPTLEGTMEARPGDWIVRGVTGEYYPVKPDIFALTYEPVQDFSGNSRE